MIVDPPARSHTWLRLMAIGAVMAGCIIGGIGLSAVSFNLMAPAPDLALSPDSYPDVQALDGSPGADAAEFERRSRERDEAIARAQEAQQEAARGERDGPVLPGPSRAEQPSRPTLPRSSSAGGANYNLQPSYGSVTLRAGFSPSSHVINMQAGGPNDARAISSACLGFVAAAPDVRLAYTASGSSPLVISTVADTDTTLIVNGPDGAWYCDDDSGEGLNPAIRFAQPQSGQYDIWVGTYGAAALAPVELRISEAGQ